MEICVVGAQARAAEGHRGNPLHLLGASKDIPGIVPHRVTGVHPQLRLSDTHTGPWCGQGRSGPELETHETLLTISSYRLVPFSFSSLFPEGTAGIKI